MVVGVKLRLICVQVITLRPGLGVLGALHEAWRCTTMQELCRAGMDADLWP